MNTCRHCGRTIAWDAEWRMWEHTDHDTALCEVNGRIEIAEPYVAPLGKETTTP
jgi:hypothetical protein